MTLSPHTIKVQEWIWHCFVLLRQGKRIFQITDIISAIERAVIVWGNLLVMDDRFYLGAEPFGIKWVCQDIFATDEQSHWNFRDCINWDQRWSWLAVFCHVLVEAMVELLEFTWIHDLRIMVGLLDWWLCWKPSIFSINHILVIGSIVSRSNHSHHAIVQYFHRYSEKISSEKVIHLLILVWVEDGVHAHRFKGRLVGLDLFR